MNSKNCLICGKNFIPSRKGGIYCSRQCAAMGHRKYKKCPICGKEFNKKGNTKYCSHKCYAKSRILLDIECPVCGKFFHPKTGQRYCSNSCRGVAQRTHKIKICPICKKEFKETYIGQIYCSNECYNSTREIKEKECPICLKIFKPYNKDIITCSRECHSKYMKAQRDNLSEEDKKKKLDALRDGEEKIISKPNKELASYLTKKGFEVTFEYPLKRYYYDLKIGNTLIEVNPRAHHNSTWAPPKNKHAKPKEKYYHQDKAIAAVEEGFNIITIRDWTTKDKVVELLNSGGPACDCYLPKDYDINKLGEPNLHRYCDKGKKHILDNNHNKEEMLFKGFVEVYDAGVKI